MLSLSGILVLGIFAQWLAWKIKLPAILPLILTGLLLGPISTLFTPNGEKLVSGDDIFNGELLFAFVSISVGVILFEGGLTLNIKEIRKVAGTVRNVLTIGVLITWIGGTLAAYYLFGLGFKISFLFGALVIVSGPTVITPILRNVRPTEKINTILKWEAILIDPLGALIAVLAYEFVITAKSQNEYTFYALKEFILTIAMGIFIGSAAAILLYYLLKKNRIPEYLRNVVTLAIVITVFAVSDFLMKESGLLSVTVMGIILANLKIEQLKNILSFKEDVSIILTSVLFLLLSSRIELEEITGLGINSIWLFLVLVLIIRPLSIFFSTIKSNLNFKEKLFISWIGPKGIVAAAVASLFSIELLRDGTNMSEQTYNDANMLLPLVFMTIVGTVVLQGASAKLVATWLGVIRVQRRGVLFIGASEVARKIALYLKNQELEVILADTSRENLFEARKMGLKVFEGNILKDDIFYVIDLSSVGRVLAMTPNSEINILALKKFEPEFGKDNVFRVMSKRESEIKDLEKPNNSLFGAKADPFALEEIFGKEVDFLEKTNTADGNFQGWLNENWDKIIPLFIKTVVGNFKVIGRDIPEIGRDETLIYLNYEKKEIYSDVDLDYGR
ncbi:sodium:proton antiporter [Fulvivirgaceae bacterium BMA12]|uniref:Sodium:proton antiporter n=1 Tax=Agaribacillus aureus TaxID=3051825 RepID=A0ABT8L335_9BACT|nr:sodium:proton antiporter [Fulvivirgaceae bacterium BMA12]